MSKRIQAQFSNRVIADVLKEFADGTRKGKLPRPEWSEYFEEAADRLNENPDYMRQKTSQKNMR
jgi:hypothetical protein